MIQIRVPFLYFLWIHSPRENIPVCTKFLVDLMMYVENGIVFIALFRIPTYLHKNQSTTTTTPLIPNKTSWETS